MKRWHINATVSILRFFVNFTRTERSSPGEVYTWSHSMHSSPTQPVMHFMHCALSSSLHVTALTLAAVADQMDGLPSYKPPTLNCYASHKYFLLVLSRTCSVKLKLKTEKNMKQNKQAQFGMGSWTDNLSGRQNKAALVLFHRSFSVRCQLNSVRQNSY